MSDAPSSIDDLLDQAVVAVNAGDLATARQLAGQVLETDTANVDAEDLLAAAGPDTGELRRLTIMFCDLVGSTELSGRQDPEQYRKIVGRYIDALRAIIEDRYDGHIAKVHGDGVLAVFGYPTAHENDATRAVMAGLDILSAIDHLSHRATQAMAESLAVRVAVHKGLVYLDTKEDEIFGLAANVAARLQELANPGTLVVSSAIRKLVQGRFDTVDHGRHQVKGVDGPLATWRVAGERTDATYLGSGRPRPLIGRDLELARLRAAWADRPSAVLVTGEPGIGKTRLAEALAEDVGDRADVLRMTGSLLHMATELAPVRGVIERGCGIRREDDTATRLQRLRDHLAASGLAADELVPRIAPILGIESRDLYEAPAVDARLLREIVADAAYAYVEALATRRPTLLIVEDAHWYDEATHGLVRQVLARQHPELMVVVTARGSGPSYGSRLDVIELAPLLPADAEELVAALDPAAVTAERRGELIARADGVPLHVEELVWSAIEAPFAEETWLRPDDSSVPDSLYDPLCARLYATAGGVAVASVAATIGRDVERDLLAEVVDVVGPEFEDALSALLGGLILERVEGRGDLYRFRHELVREVAYDLQPPSTRRRVHGRVADALAGGVGDDGIADWIVLARHYEQANRSSDASSCYERAAEDARRRGSLGEARAHLGRAIELVAQLPGTPPERQREIALRLRRGFITVSVEGNASVDAGQDFERCFELAIADPTGDEMFSTLICLWGYYTVRADLARARRVLELLLTVLVDARDASRLDASSLRMSDERRFLLEHTNTAGFGMLDWYGGRFDDARTKLETSVASVEHAGVADTLASTWLLPNEPIAAMHTHLALARFMTGDPAGAASAMAAAERRTDELPFPQGPFSRAYALSYRGWMAIQARDFDAADEVADRILAIAADHGFDFWTLTGYTQKASVGIARAFVAEPLDAAALEAISGPLAGQISAWQMIDVRVLLPHMMTSLAEVRVRLGDRDGAQMMVDQSLGVAESTGVHFYDAETLRVAAHLEADPAAVATQLVRAGELARSQGAVAWDLRIACDRYDLEGSPARGYLEETLAKFAPGASYPELEAARARLTGG